MELSGWLLMDKVEKRRRKLKPTRNIGGRFVLNQTAQLGFAGERS
jgi:hypothetical protein